VACPLFNSAGGSCQGAGGIGEEVILFSRLSLRNCCDLQAAFVCRIFSSRTPDQTKRFELRGERPRGECPSERSAACKTAWQGYRQRSSSRTRGEGVKMEAECPAAAPVAREQRLRRLRSCYSRELSSLNVQFLDSFDSGVLTAPPYSREPATQPALLGAVCGTGRIYSQKNVNIVVATLCLVLVAFAPACVCRAVDLRQAMPWTGCSWGNRNNATYAVVNLTSIQGPGVHYVY
jgi:hypothetical protein